MKNSVTSELRKSITKVTGETFTGKLYGDTRMKGLAVGVKVCYNIFSDSAKDSIVKDMESKGFKFAYVRFNSYKPGTYPTVEGTRFCFYRKY